MRSPAARRGGAPRSACRYGCAGVGSWTGSVRFGLRVQPGRRRRHVRERATGTPCRSASTPSPSGSLLPRPGSRTRRRRGARMSTTSSPSRRPFGKPALSPASTPNRFCVRRRRHAEVDLQRVGRHRVRRDLRQSGHARQQRRHDVGAVRLRHVQARNSRLMSFASSGFTHVLARTVRGVVVRLASRLNLSFLPSGMTTSLTSGLPSRLTWTHLRLAPCRVRR